MEIRGPNGPRTRISPDSTTVFGRGNGHNPKDLSVSRRHISFNFSNQTGPRVSFEVLGKNPVWVSAKEEDGKVKVFKRFERGQLGAGDKLCLSAKDPVWLTVNEEEEEREKGEIVGRVNEELSQSLESASGFEGDGELSGLGSVDVSDIDPVQEFGFLVIGHEFDRYPKQRIRAIKDWDWFLEEPRGDSDDEESFEKKGKRGGRRKRKKARGGDDDVDEEWTGESEDEMGVTAKARKVRGPDYHTRSKDRGKSQKDRATRRTSTKKSAEEENNEEYEDEEDETLGGFIVDEDTVEEDEEEKEEEEEEEEFIEDEDEDDDELED